MTAKRTANIVGVFEDRFQADRAIADLRKAGFAEDQIGVASRHSEGETWGTKIDEAGDENSHAGTGALTGALAGMGLGALAGLGILAGIIPAVGPAIAGGTLGILLSNAAAGAGIAGLTGALIGAGVPEEEAEYYQGEFESGRTIVTIKADGRSDEALAILRRHGAYDMQSRGTVATGAAHASHAADMAAGAAATAAPRSTAARSTATAGDKIAVHEEQLHAHTQPVEAGEVRVRKDVVTEHKTLEVPVQREEVVIERHPVSGRASASDIHAGEEIRIPVMEEEVIVDKQAVVKEEVSVGKRVVQDTERVEGDVRKEQVRVERKGDVDVTACDTDRNTRRS